MDIAGRTVRSNGFRFAAVLIAAIGLTPALPLLGQSGPDAASIEEAAEFGRRAAKAALAGSPRVFAEALDIDGVLVQRLGVPTWEQLRPRQRDQLRTAVREQFLYLLAGSRSVGNEIAWSWAQSVGDDVHILLGLKIGDKTLKTRWIVRHIGAGWKITDIVLSDPGISLGEMAIQALGPEPIRRRERVREAEEAAYPRLIGLGAMALLVLFLAPRLKPSGRLLLFLTMSAPAILVVVDGTLAVNRTLEEKYALREAAVRDSWQEEEQLALDAERDGDTSQASRHWARALAHGAPPAPIEYQMGLAALRRGDPGRARLSLERALAEGKPAPGAARELASLDAAAGRYAEAEQYLERYIALSGPDPESLSLVAVLQTNLGRAADSVRSLEFARTLVGDEWRAAELEAQVRARASDAPGAIGALRSLDAQGLVNRAALRADPNYLPIANDPAWVAFINERTPLPANPAAKR